MSYLGLDIGTTGCKAVAFDEGGRPLAAAYREYPVLAPQEGWAELDSARVCDDAFAVLREVAAACHADPIRALGISTQGEAFTPVGADGEMLGNAMVSSDARAAALAAEWSATFGRQELYRLTGHTAHPMFTLFKLLWLRDHQPETWQRAHRFLCFEDLLQQRLGLDPAISWPLAGRTMLFNVRTHAWDEAILACVGLDGARLARPLPSGAVAGEVAPAIAHALGLGRGTMVVAGGHDQTCAALGAGVASAGRAAYAIGTVECITPAFPEPVFRDALFESNLCTYDHTVAGMYTTVAFSLTGGNLLRWFRDEWGQAEAAVARQSGQSAYTLLLQGMAPQPTNLMVLPYFTPSGTPYFDTDVRGAIVGLRLSTTRAEVLRALLEGVAFEMRLNVDILHRAGIPVTELVAVGGGAQSRAWLQLKADVLNRPIQTVAVTEAGCLGAAMLAAAAHRQEAVAPLARRWVRVTDTITPDAGRAAYYDGRFPAYLRLYPALRELI